MFKRFFFNTYLKIGEVIFLKEMQLYREQIEDEQRSQFINYTDKLQQALNKHTERNAELADEINFLRKKLDINKIKEHQNNLFDNKNE